MLSMASFLALHLPTALILLLVTRFLILMTSLYPERIRKLLMIFVLLSIALYRNLLINWTAFISKAIKLSPISMVAASDMKSIRLLLPLAIWLAILTNSLPVSTFSGLTTASVGILVDSLKTKTAMS